MKRLLLAAAMSAALLTSACSTAGTQAITPITQAVANGLPHCHVTGSLNGGVGGLAGSGTGVSQNITIDCPAQPWPSAPAPAPAP